MSEDETHIRDVLIIGAGLSGLCAAKILRSKWPDVDIKLLEKSHKAGGQLDGLQSRWITPNHFHAIDLCRELGVSLGGEEATADSNHYGLRHITPFEGLLFGRLAKIESERLMTEIDSLCSSRFITNNPMNMDVFLERKLLLEESKVFFRFLIKISCGFNPVELTVTDWIKFCRSVSSMKNLYEMLMKAGTHLAPVDGGWDALVEKLIELVGVENIAFSTNATRVEQTEEDVVLVSDGYGTKWRARTIICAVSCNDLLGIDFVPIRPLEVRAPWPNANITHVTNFQAKYHTCFWRDHGFSGNIFLPSHRIVCTEKDGITLEGAFFHAANLSYHRAQCSILNILAVKLKCHSLLYPVHFQASQRDLSFYFEVSSPHTRRIIFSSSNVSCWFRGFINGSIQGGLKAAILTLLEVRPQTINFKDVTEMQCLHFKYFPQYSFFERWWYSINLAGMSRTAAIIGTVAASVVMFHGLTKIATGLEQFETE